MASNPPPFLVEDNTDEDFFDRLVDDDDDSVVASSYGPALVDGNKSDDTGALSNLNINELDGNYDVCVDDVSNSSISGNANNLSTEIRTVGQIYNAGNEEHSGNPLSHSFDFDNLIPDSKNEGDIDEVLSESTSVNKEGGESISDRIAAAKSSDVSATAGVKEMDWSAFHSDSNKNDGNSFDTDSDFFTELGGGVNGGDEWGNIVDNLGCESKIANEAIEQGSSFGQNSNYEVYNDGNNYIVAADQNADMQDLNSSQYWESMYPGWKYEASTGQWYQVDGYDAAAIKQENVGSNLSSTWGMTNEKTEVSYLQKTAQSVSGTVTEGGRTESVTDWNQGFQASNVIETTNNWNQVPQTSAGTSVIPYQVSQDNDGYPPHMVFDPQYPGWFYDTDAQEWFSLESYVASTHSTANVQDQINQDGNASTSTLHQNNNSQGYTTYGKDTSYLDQTFSSQDQNHNWSGSISNYSHQGSKMWQTDTAAYDKAHSQYSGNQQIKSHHGQLSAQGNQQSFYSGNQQIESHQVRLSAQGSQHSFSDNEVAGSYYENVRQGQNDFYSPSRSIGFVGGGNSSQQFNDSRISQYDPKNVLNDFHSNMNPASLSNQQIQGPQISYAQATGRSSAGRPPHALVAFGFGGKLIVMKDNGYNESMDLGSQDRTKGSISVLNLVDIVNENAASNHETVICNYFRSLTRLAAPGPLTGGNVGIKDLNKWIDERISNTDAADVDYQKAEGLRLLLSLLKMGCQYYGKLRSPYGTESVLKESDGPELAVAKLFASANRTDMQFSQYGAVAQCLQQMPAERQMQVTAADVQRLLVLGKKKEALQCAQDGQLWGPALVLAAQLGDQFYAETVKQMALHQLVPGSPLRTLCLLIAGRPADVFSSDTQAINSLAGAVNLPQQLPQFGGNGMLDDWRENLAVVTANRTKDDELVLIHLGDCLWKERSDIIAAHICYLVAEASFEPYSDSARLCLVGADHWKFPRTYASPEAIQRTEIYEYSKTLGNSQFVLLPFQPYKLVYAHMLAEVGRISDALKYCQAVLKSLKTGRNPEAETLKQLVSSLDERIKAHQEGGFSTNLAPKKLVGKLLNLFDSTAHRVVGGLPPPVPTAGGPFQSNMNHHQSMGPRVSTSQSTMAMSSLMPSQSMEPISEWPADNNRMSMHARSVSEPDFGRTPRQDETQLLKEASLVGEQEKASASGRRSRFGSFGFGSQLLQKTVGLVLKPRQDRQAKLGDSNKFYYDDKLKRWVEEGAAVPAEEEALPPPPTTSVFQNGTSDYNLKSAMQSEISHTNRSPEYGSPTSLENSLGIPPLPPASNQYSARGRMGVRSRYVDTFNKGGGNSGNLFQSPSVPSIKPASGPGPKFFVPTPVISADQPVDTLVNSIQDTSSTHEQPSTSPLNDSFQSTAYQSSINLQRFASMNNIPNSEVNNISGSFSTPSRRTASWSGSFNDSFSPPHRPSILGTRQPSLTATPPLTHSSKNGGSFGDDLHEVEL